MNNLYEFEEYSKLNTILESIQLETDRLDEFSVAKLVDPKVFAKIVAKVRKKADDAIEPFMKVIHKSDDSIKVSKAKAKMKVIKDKKKETLEDIYKKRIIAKRQHDRNAAAAAIKKHGYDPKKATSKADMDWHRQRLIDKGIYGGKKKKTTVKKLKQAA